MDGNDTSAESYRTPMRVTAVYCYRAGSRMQSFPICPRCGLTMEREYQAYCDRCGQALDWKCFSNAEIVEQRRRGSWENRWKNR